MVEVDIYIYNSAKIIDKKNFNRFFANYMNIVNYIQVSNKV